MAKKLKKFLLYNLFIPQERIMEVAPRLSLEGAIILEYISRWGLFSGNGSRKTIINNEEYVWLHYPTMIAALPILKIRSKDRITRNINKLVKLGLLKKAQLKDNTLFVRLTDLAASIYLNPPPIAEEVPDKEKEETCPYDKDSPVLTIRTGPVLTVRTAQKYKYIQNKDIIVEGAEAPSKSPSSFQNNGKKKGMDPRVMEIIGYFVEACENIRGFKPIISWHIEVPLIKKRLASFSPEEIKDELFWFLNSQESYKFGCSLRVALSSVIFNKWLSTRNL